MPKPACYTMLHAAAAGLGMFAQVQSGEDSCLIEWVISGLTPGAHGEIQTLPFAHALTAVLR